MEILIESIAGRYYVQYSIFIRCIIIVHVARENHQYTQVVSLLWNLLNSLTKAYIRLPF